MNILEASVNFSFTFIMDSFFIGTACASPCVSVINYSCWKTIWHLRLLAKRRISPSCCTLTNPLKLDWFGVEQVARQTHSVSYLITFKCAFCCTHCTIDGMIAEEWWSWSSSSCSGEQRAWWVSFTPQLSRHWDCWAVHPLVTMDVLTIIIKVNQVSSKIFLGGTTGATGLIIALPPPSLAGRDGFFGGQTWNCFLPSHQSNTMWPFFLYKTGISLFFSLSLPSSLEANAHFIWLTCTHALLHT